MTYYIYTDSFQAEEIEAASLAEAIAAADLPANVTDAASFEAWLEDVGGWGEIRENGETIAHVAR